MKMGSECEPTIFYSQTFPPAGACDDVQITTHNGAMAEDEAKEEQVKGIKMEEVEKHSSIDDLWLVIDGASPRRLFSDDDSLRRSRHFGLFRRRSAALDRSDRRDARRVLTLRSRIP
jgi:hypothetical protein